MLFLDVFMRWLHILAAVTWVGALIFMNVVLTPAVAPKGVPPQFVRLMGINRFRPFGWGSITVLLLTGVYNFWRYVGSAAALASPYGVALITKVTLYLVMVIVTAVNSVLIPNLMKQAAPAAGGMKPEATVLTLGKRLVFLSRVNLILGLLVLLLASALRSLPIG